MNPVSIQYRFSASRIAATLLALCAIFCTPTASFADVHWSAELSPADIRAGEGGQIVIKALLDPGSYIYSTTEAKGGPTATTIEVDGGTALSTAGEPAGPPAAASADGFYHVPAEKYERAVTFGFGAVVAEGTTGPQTAKIKIKYEERSGATAGSVKTVEIPLTFTPAAGPIRDDHRDAIGTVPAQPASAPTVEKGEIEKTRSKGLLVFMGYCFVGGLLSLLTPCVFPMIPLTVNFFTKRQAASRKAGIKDALAYCFGIVATFTGVGLLVTILFGATGLQTIATNPYLNIAFAILFVTLAANLLGFFEFVMPQGLTQSAHSKSREGGLLGPIFMGVASTVSSFTCTGAIVGSLLATAATGDRLYPFMGMLAFSTAFAAPFFLLALFPQYLSRLPRSGAWMISVKGYMGFIELAAAIKFLSNADLVWQTNLLPRSLFLYLWAVIVGIAGLYLLGAVPVKGHDRTGIGIPRRILGVITVLLAFGCVYGARGASLGSVEAFLPPEKSTWLQDYARAQELAKKENKPIFINFTGVTCTNCRWMEKNMFPRQDVKDSLKNYVLVELYTDRKGKLQANDERNQALQQKLTGTVTLPVYVVVTPTGDAVRNFQGSTPDPARFVGFLKQ